jgi:uncharacterized protein involved in exopolysaccharide biosynthesis
MGDSAGPEAPSQPAPPQAGGRRTQLRVVRESIMSLSKDIWTFRKSHLASTKKLEKQVAALRSELASHARSKEFGNLSKSYKTSTKRMENQVAAIRKEMAALKGNIAKDTARGRARQEAMLSKILAKVSAKSSKPAKRAKKR